jgi:hypothetical protein
MEVFRDAFGSFWRPAGTVENQIGRLMGKAVNHFHKALNVFLNNTQENRRTDLRLCKSRGINNGIPAGMLVKPGQVFPADLIRIFNLL